MASNKIPIIAGQGGQIPAVGYGTMLFPDAESAVELITHSLNCGYRHIDTARKYGSEKWVGEAIRTNRVPREDIWITTKVTEENATADDFARSVETSLKTLDVTYVDLLLIHWPQPNVPLEETLGALARTKREGLAKNIGVSNFTVSLLDEAVNKCPEPIFTNQIEYHAYIRQDKLLAACFRHNLLVTCHVPLARGALLSDPVISKIAKLHDRTPAQIALKWLVQQSGVVVVPRALEARHIEENIDIFDFELNEKEMGQISELQSNNLRVVNPPERSPEWDEE